MANHTNIIYQSQPQADSLWAQVSPLAPETSQLEGSHEAQVTIVGAGLCGLSSALHLARQGVKTIVVDAEAVGWGASGRNNGQVIPGLKHDPVEVIKLLGPEAGERLVQCAGNAPDLVFSLIENYSIDCDGVRKGWIQPARSDAGLTQIESRMKQWLQRQAPVTMINPPELSARLGTDWYRGAWLDKRGGSVNPLAYTRGLAQAALQEGAKIYTHSPVTSIQKNNNRWVIKTPQGEVLTQQLLLCTNAYGKLDDQLRRSIVPIRTAQIASEPLLEQNWSNILPKGEAASDASRLLTSFRITADKRLIMGGAYATGGDEIPVLFNRLKKAAENRFPSIRNIRWQFHWSGYLALTPNHLPHIFELAPNCYAPIGCNGRGIAMTTATGKALAELMTGGQREACPLPISGSKPITFHQFRNIGIAANVAWCDLLDRLDV
jgi:glycine/D-amino acid oxidase-like deaminating enzyme